MIEFDEDKQKRKLNDLLKKEEEELVQLLAAKHSLGYVDLSITLINTDALRFIEESVAREFKVVAFSLIDKKIKNFTVFWKKITVYFIGFYCCNWI